MDATAANQMIEDLQLQLKRMRENADRMGAPETAMKVGKC